MARWKPWLLAAGSLAVLAWVTPTSAWSQAAATVAPGDTVRVKTPARIVIPDLITMERGRVETRVPHEQEGDLVVLRDGDKILHVPRPGSQVTGRLVSVSDEAITLRDRGDRTVSIPRPVVERLEVRHGGEHRRVGVLLGAAAAFALGYAIGYSGEQHCSGWCMPEVAGVGLGLLLAIPGAAAGAAVAGGQWEPVSTDNLRVGIATRQGGAAATVSVRF
jgi:hypothetical protein